MKNYNEYTLKMGELEISPPIVQGGMGVGISMSSLASAVANEGGVGTLSAAGVALLDGSKEYNSPASLIKEIEKTKGLTKGVIGVNIMVALKEYDELCKAAMEAGIDIIFSGAGLPLNLPSLRPEGTKTKLVPIISSAKAAKMIYKYWTDKYSYVPDAFVIEGPLAGGHLGFKNEQIEDEAYSLENLLKEIKEAVTELEAACGKKIPLIVGGGIFTGEDVRKFLELGADGIQMATRFVATEECDADRAFKEAYVNCKEEDIMIIKSPVGLPGRAIKGVFLDRVKGGETVPKACPFHCIRTCVPEKSPYCISVALLNACRGNFNTGFAFVGAKGYMVDRIVPVKEVFESLKAEFGG